MALDRRRKPYYYLSCADVDANSSEVDDDALHDCSREDVARFLVSILCKSGGKSTLEHILDRKLKPLTFWEIDTPAALKEFCQSFPRCFVVRTSSEGEEEEVEVTTKINLCCNHVRKMGSCAEDGECGFLHLCRFFMLCGQCDCKGLGQRVYGHQLRTDHNVCVLKHFLMDHLTMEDLQTLVRRRHARVVQTLPMVCRYYNSQSGCSKGPRCLMLHLCKRYVFSDCKFGEECMRSHDTSEEMAKAILDKFAIAPDDLLSVIAINPNPQLSLLPASTPTPVPKPPTHTLKPPTHTSLPSLLSLLPPRLASSQPGLLPDPPGFPALWGGPALLPCWTASRSNIGGASGMVSSSSKEESREGHWCHPTQKGSGQKSLGGGSDASHVSDRGESCASSDPAPPPAVFSTLFSRRRGHVMESAGQKAGRDAESEKEEDASTQQPLKMNPFSFMTVADKPRQGPKSEEALNGGGQEGRATSDRNAGEDLSGQSHSFIPLKQPDIPLNMKLTPGRPVASVPPQMKIKPELGGCQKADLTEQPKEEEIGCATQKTWPGRQLTAAHTAPTSSEKSNTPAPKPTSSKTENLQLVISSLINNVMKLHAKNPGPEQHLINYLSELAQPDKLDQEMKAAEELESEKKKLEEGESSAHGGQYRSDGELSDSDQEEGVSTMKTTQEKVLFDYNHRPTVDLISDMLNSRENSPCRETPTQPTTATTTTTSSRQSPRVRRKSRKQESGMQYETVESPEEEGERDLDEVSSVNSAISDIMSSEDEAQNSGSRTCLTPCASSQKLAATSKYSENKIEKTANVALEEVPSHEKDATTQADKAGKKQEGGTSSIERKTASETVAATGANTDDQTGKSATAPGKLDKTPQAAACETAVKPTTAKPGSAGQKSAEPKKPSIAERKQPASKSSDSGKQSEKPSEKSSEKPSEKPKSSEKPSEKPESSEKFSEKPKSSEKPSGSDRGSSGQRRSPTDKNVSGSRRSPRKTSPANRKSSPGHRRASPGYRSSGYRRSPDWRRSPHRRRSPYRRRSSDKRRSPFRRMSPDRSFPDKRRSPNWRAPERRSSPGRRQSPGKRSGDRRSPERRRSPHSRSNDPRTSAEGNRRSCPESARSELSWRASPHRDRPQDWRRSPHRRWSPGPRGSFQEEKRWLSRSPVHHRRSPTSPERLRGPPLSLRERSPGFRRNSRSPVHRQSSPRAFEEERRCSPIGDLYRHSSDMFERDDHRTSPHPYRRTSEKWERGWDDRDTERRDYDTERHRFRSAEREKDMDDRRLREREKMDREMDEHPVRSRSHERPSRSIELNQRDFERTLGENHDDRRFLDERQTHHPSRKQYEDDHVHEERETGHPSRNRSGSANRRWEGGRMSHGSSPLRWRSPEGGMDRGSPGRARQWLGSRQGSRERDGPRRRPGDRRFRTEEDQWQAEDRALFPSRRSPRGDGSRDREESFHGEYSREDGSGRERSYPGAFHDPSREERFWKLEGRLRDRLGPSPERFEGGEMEGGFSEDGYRERGSRGGREVLRSVSGERHSLSRERCVQEGGEGEGDWRGDFDSTREGRSQGLLPTPPRHLKRDLDPEGGEQRSRGDWRKSDTSSRPGPCHRGSSHSPHSFPSERRSRPGLHRSPSFHAEDSRGPARYDKRQRGECVSETQGPSLQEKIHDFLGEARNSTSRGPSPSDEHLQKFGVPSSEDADRADLAGGYAGQEELVDERVVRKHQGRVSRHNPGHPSKRSRDTWDAEQAEEALAQKRRLHRESDSRSQGQAFSTAGHHGRKYSRNRQGVQVKMVFNKNNNVERAGSSRYLDLDRPEGDYAETGLFGDGAAEEVYYRESVEGENPGMEEVFYPEDDVSRDPPECQDDYGDMIEAHRARVMKSDLRNLLRTRRKWSSTDAEKEHIQIRVRRQEHRERAPRQQYVDEDGREVVVGDQD